MQTPFPFESMLLFGSLAIMLLVGVALRAKIRFFQKFLIPSCLIGGILGLVLLNAGVIDFSVKDLEMLAYHFFNISFISVGLTSGNNQNKTSATKKVYLKGSLWMALTQTTCFSLQAVIGGLFVILFGLFGLELFPTFGYFAPLGFEEGPGQALSFGKVWEGLGFENAATIGLTFAALGYFFAFFVGVPLVNWGIRKGLSTHDKQDLPQDFLTGIIPKDKTTESAGALRLHSANIDSLAFQAALVGLVYVLTYMFIKNFGRLFPADVSSMLWGFFFFGGLSFAFIVRKLMEKFGIDYLIDPGVQRRITGWSIDFLIVSTVMAIQLKIVLEFIIPISLISLTCGILTTFAVVFLGKRLGSYNLERTAAIYGAVTGTVSCGLLLLRIADPDFKTPAAIEVAIMSVFMLLPLPLLLILVNSTVWWNWSVSLTVLLFFCAMLLTLLTMKILKLWGSPKF